MATKKLKNNLLNMGFLPKTFDCRRGPATFLRVKRVSHRDKNVEKH